MESKFGRTEKLLILLLVFVGVGGLVGGFSFVTKTDGSGLGMTTNYLENAPAKDYFWPGVFLLIFMCLWPFLNALAIIFKKPWVRNSLFYFGIFTMAWIIYETITIKTLSPLQPIIFVIGLFVLIGSRKMSLSQAN